MRAFWIRKGTLVGLYPRELAVLCSGHVVDQRCDSGSILVNHRTRGFADGHLRLVAQLKAIEIR